MPSFSAGSGERAGPAAPLDWRTAGAVAIVGALTAATGLGLGPPLGMVAPGVVGLALIALALWRAPGAVAASLPVLLPPPQFLKVFAYEVALLPVAAGVALLGWRGRRPWLLRLDAIEVAVGGLLLWAMATAFWCSSLWWYTFGVRKLGIGLLALWTAWRLGRWLPGEDLRLGIAGGACALSLATLQHAASVGWIDLANPASRPALTNLGWGTSNFLAALLVLMSPTALHVALHDPRRAGRVLGWITLPLASLVIALAASRGGALMVGLIALYVILRHRPGPRTMLVVAGLLVSLALLLFGPAGDRLLGRFTDVREAGSMLIRLLYFREGWRRLVDNLPWGMGLGQGYVHPDHLGQEDPHNYWLVLGPELGLPGLLLWGTVLALLWLRIRHAIRAPATRELGLTMQLTFVISQVNCLFEPTFPGLQYQFLFYWIFGSFLGSLSPPLEPTAPRTRSPSLRTRT